MYKNLEVEVCSTEEHIHTSNKQSECRLLDRTTTIVRIDTHGLTGLAPGEACILIGSGIAPGEACILIASCTFS